MDHTHIWTLGPACSTQTSEYEHVDGSPFSITNVRSIFVSCTCGEIRIARYNDETQQWEMEV